MTFTGNEDHSISLEDAAKLTANYRSNAGPNPALAGFFGEETLKQILNQTHCVGIRIYYGEENDGTPTLVLVGADEDENDLIDGKIAERELPCPPYCSVQNTLNSD